MIGINIVITLKDITTGNYVTIPVTPEVISYNNGEALFNSVNIANMGSLDFFAGVALDSVAWSSFFPKRYDPSYCKVTNLAKPSEYQASINSWKNTGARLQLIIPTLGINKSVKVKAFQHDYKGFEGDIYYSITLVEDKQIRPVKVTQVLPKIPPRKKKVPENRPAPPAPPAPPVVTYTVVRGDCLSLIGKRLGKDWRAIYERNKAVIGPNPNLIYPGQVYVIP